MIGFKVLVLDGPTVTVHKGWDIPGRRRKSHTSTATEIFPDKNVQIKSSPVTSEKSKSKNNASSRNPRRFEFIPASNPGTKNPEAQKLVRKHVRNDFLHRTHAQLKNQHNSKPTANHTSPPHIPTPRNIGHPTSLHLYNFPTYMPLSSHMLLESYISHAPPRIYPLEKCLECNPLRSDDWFRFAVGDEAMLNGILYAGALYAGMGKEGLWYYGETVRVVGVRLKEEVRKGVENGGEIGEGVDEGIGAVSCLAVGEAIAGRQGLWRIHMEGIKQMIRVRKPKPQLAAMIEAKIRRADTTGATTYATYPSLTYTPSHIPPIWSILPPALRLSVILDSRSFFEGTSISSTLILTLTNLILFTRTVSRDSDLGIRLEPAAFMENLWGLEYQLLGSEQGREREISIERGMRCASLLYLKELLGDCKSESRALLEGIRNALAGKGIGGEGSVQEKEKEVWAWITTVGACCSRSEGLMREFFVGVLKGVGADEVFERGEITRLLDLRAVFGGAFERLLEEITS